MNRLGYSEKEMFRMTPRKFYLLFREYLELNGYRKKKTEYSFDSLP
jgi:hypothetical protein